MLLYQILASTTHGKKHKKSHTWIINLKHKLRFGIKIFNYLMDCVLYQIFQIISSISSKKHQKVTDNLIENRK